METCITFENNLARAIKIDLDKLILTYEKEQTLLYQPFTQIWRNMTFSLIYGGQVFAAELKVFTELLFRIVLKYLITPKSIYAQTGALYALYGLYYKQPFKRWIKIRVTYEQVKVINELIETLQVNGAKEALFVYAKLCSDNAFDYVASELLRGLEVAFGRQQYVGHILPYETDEGSISNSIQKLIGDEIKELESVDEMYRNEFEKFKANSNILLVMQNTGESISEKLRKIASEMNKTSSKQEEEETKDDIQTRRRKLRQKAMKADVKSQKEISRLFDAVKVKFEEVSDSD